MPTYLYKITPARLGMVTEAPTPQETEIVSKHFAYLKSLRDNGTLLLAGRTSNSDSATFGISIFNAENDEAAQAIMQNDPAVQHGVMIAELYPYRMALLSTTPEKFL